MTATIKIATPPIEPRLARRVDFDLGDAEEWSRFAVKSRCWRMTFDHGSHSVDRTAFETVVAIAAPDGRAAVWYGQTRLVDAKKKNIGFWGALDTVKCPRVAAYWDKHRTKGGDRDVSLLALAAGRVLHARAFDETPSARDMLLAEFAALEGADRPATPTLLKASDAMLEAASTLVAIENYQGMRALLTGKGVTG